VPVLVADRKSFTIVGVRIVVTPKTVWSLQLVLTTQLEGSAVPPPPVGPTLLFPSCE